tara:strand:- start:1927 stop:2472 length:546 start_codon:yes stop_codon:yes gene_type:complete
MANQRLTDKSAFSGNFATDDLFHVVDASDTSANPNGTSKKVTNEQILQTTKKSISNQAFLDMRTGAGVNDFVTLIPATGSGTFILPINITMFMTYASATETSSINLYVGYDSTTVSYYAVYFRNFMKNVTTNNTLMLPIIPPGIGVNPSSIANAPLVMYSSANFTGGFSADVYITYRKCSI